MSKAKTRRLLAASLSQLEPKLAAAFIAAFDASVSSVQMGMIADLIERGDVDGVVRALIMKPQHWALFDQRISEAFTRGGVEALAALPKTLPAGGGKLTVHFQGTNPRAQAWLSNHGSSMLTALRRDQTSLIQSVIRENLGTRHPRTIARDLIGKPGLLRLTPNEAQYVLNARSELMDPDRIGNYLTRQARNKRFDRTVEKAIREGRALNATQARNISDAYSGRLLRLRAERIARTETLTALNAGRHEAMEQLLETDDVESVTKVWDATGDARTRPAHMAMEGQTVDIKEAFTSPTGGKLKYPGDRSLGAGGHDTIHCRCTVFYRPRYAA